MKVLVTGGAGFIGSNVVKLLLAKGYKVFVLDDFSHADFRNIYGLDCEVICGDVVEDGIWKKLPSLNAVIHLAAVTDTTLDDDRKMVMVNFNGFKNALEYVLKKKIPLVYASSAGVYGNGPSPMRETQDLLPHNIYAYSKVLCDRAAAKVMNKKGVPPLVGLRYFNVYGPGEHHKGKSASMIYQIYLQMRDNRRPRLFKFGEQRRDFIFVKDVAAVTVKALESRRSAIVNVGTGKARSFNDIVDVLNGLMGKNLSPEYFDNPYTGTYQNYTEADIRVLRSVLKYRPRYSLEEGIKAYFQYLNTQ